MGAEWDSRFSVAIGFILTVVIVFILSNFLKGCESFGEVLIATVLGILVGLTFFYINKAIFTQESMNFLGLPYLVNKSQEGSPIYVCSTQPNNQIE